MTNPQSDNLPEERDIFLSHRSSNKEFVRKLAGDIESNLFNGKNLLSWVDEAEIRHGQSITEMINFGLEKSRFIGLVMTPDYFLSESGWTDAEWHAALFTDPDNKKGRIIPILSADCPYVPILLRHLLVVDFRGNRYRKALGELLTILRDEPLPRPSVFRGQLIDPVGRISRSTLIAERAAPQADPDVIEERLYCNLLPVEKLPTYVYLSPIAFELYHEKRNGEHTLPSKSKIIDAIHTYQRETGQNKFTPAFRLFEDKIMTFHDLESVDCPLASVIDEHEVEPIETETLLNDEDMRKIVIALLNMSLDRHMHRLGLVIDRTKSRRFFFPPDEGGANVITWRPVKNQATRTVAKPCLKDGEIQFWRHLGAYLKMLYLANKVYLHIRPTWVFTEDGTRIKSGPTLGRLVIRWTGAERNLNLLYHIRFWTTTLQSRPGPMILIQTGDQNLEISKKPAFIKQSHGIKHDYKNLMTQLDKEANVIVETEEVILDLGFDEQIDDEDIIEEEDEDDGIGEVKDFDE